MTLLAPAGAEEARIPSATTTPAALHCVRALSVENRFIASPLAGAAAVNAKTACGRNARNSLVRHDPNGLCAADLWLGEAGDEGDELALPVRVRFLKDCLELVARR
jgi:hypothetical protein